MKRSMIVTDVTRMGAPGVCVAGFFADDGTAVRPIMPYRSHERVTEGFLWKDDRLVVMPFAEVRLEFLRRVSDPPHTEDWEIDPRYRPEAVRVLSMEERRDFLRNHLDDSVGAIFGAPIQGDKYIRKGDGHRSLGTILTRQVSEIRYGHREYSDGVAKWDYRIWFTDYADREYSLAITDLTFRTACDYLITHKEWSVGKVSEWLTGFLGERDVYLRIGLARAWEKYPDRCYIQVTGVYSFPDYLGGKTLADFV